MNNHCVESLCQLMTACSALSCVHKRGDVKINQIEKMQTNASCGQGGRQYVHSFAARPFHHQIEAALHSS